VSGVVKLDAALTGAWLSALLLAGAPAARADATAADSVAAVAARYPAFDGGKSGSIAAASSVDGFHATLGAYEALQTLAQGLCALPPIRAAGKVVLRSDDDVAALLAYRQLMPLIDGLARDFRAALASVPEEGRFARESVGTVAGYAGAAAFSSVASLGRLFRSDTKLAEESVALSDADLAAAIEACDLRRFVVVAHLATPEVLARPAAAGLRGRLQSLRELRGAADVAWAAAAAEVAAMERPRITLTREERKRYAVVQTVSLRLKALATTHDRLETALATVDDASGEPALLRLLRAEALENLLAAEPGAVLLSASVALRGGFSVVSQSIWRADRFYSQGGLAVRYRMEKADGTVLGTGLLTQESPAREVHWRKP
jgi:hypothetical protein